MTWYRYSIVQEENFCQCAYRTIGVNITLLLLKKMGFRNTQLHWAHKLALKLLGGGGNNFAHELEAGFGEWWSIPCKQTCTQLAWGKLNYAIKAWEEGKNWRQAICFELGINIHWYIPIYSLVHSYRHTKCHTSTDAFLVNLTERQLDQYMPLSSVLRQMLKMSRPHSLRLQKQLTLASKWATGLMRR